MPLSIFMSIFFFMCDRLGPSFSPSAVLMTSYLCCLLISRGVGCPSGSSLVSRALNSEYLRQCIRNSCLQWSSSFLSTRVMSTKRQGKGLERQGFDQVRVSSSTSIIACFSIRSSVVSPGKPSGMRVASARLMPWGAPTQYSWMGRQCSMPTTQATCTAAWKASLSRAVMQRSLGRLKMWGMKFSAACLVEKGVVSCLFLSSTVRKMSRISWMDSPLPRIILQRVSGMPPSMTLWRPMSPVQRNFSMRGNSVRLPPRMCLLMASTKTGVISFRVSSGFSWRKGQEQAYMPCLQVVWPGRLLLTSMSIVKRFTRASSQVQGRCGSIDSIPSSRQSSTSPSAHLWDMNRCRAMYSEGSTCRNIRSVPAAPSNCTWSMNFSEVGGASGARVTPISSTSSTRSMSPWLALGRGLRWAILIFWAQTDSRWLKRQSSGARVLNRQASRLMPRIRFPDSNNIQSDHTQNPLSLNRPSNRSKVTQSREGPLHAPAVLVAGEPVTETTHLLALLQYRPKLHVYVDQVLPEGLGLPLRQVLVDLLEGLHHFNKRPHAVAKVGVLDGQLFQLRQDVIVGFYNLEDVARLLDGGDQLAPEVLNQGKDVGLEGLDEVVDRVPGLENAPHALGEVVAPYLDCDLLTSAQVEQQVADVGVGLHDLRREDAVGWWLGPIHQGEVPPALGAVLDFEELRPHLLPHQLRLVHGPAALHGLLDEPVQPRHQDPVSGPVEGLLGNLEEGLDEVALLEEHELLDALHRAPDRVPYPVPAQQVDALDVDPLQHLVEQTAHLHAHADALLRFCLNNSCAFGALHLFYGW